MFTNDRALMCRAVVAAVVTVAPQVPLLAQGLFEGVVTYDVTTRGRTSTSTLSVKGSRLRSDDWRMGNDARAGMVMIDAKGDLILGTPERKAYMRPGARLSDDKVTNAMTFTKTGRTESVLGYKCDYYTIHQVTFPDKDYEVCITTALGTVAMIPGKFIVGADAKAQFPNGFFVLKSLDAKGNVLAVATKIERRSLSDALFEPPADWREIKTPGAPGGRP